MAHGELEDLAIFRDAERFCDRIYALVHAWPAFDVQTVGSQLVRAADSVGANIAESFGRFHYGDKAHFLYFARGSAHETIFWIRRAQARGLLEETTATKAIDLYKALTLSLNRFIRQLKARKEPSSGRNSSIGRIGESPAGYATADDIIDRFRVVPPDDRDDPF